MSSCRSLRGEGREAQRPGGNRGLHGTLPVNGCLEVAVRGGDKPDVDRDALVSSDRLDLSSWIALNSFTWVEGLMSEISSRKIVPPWASSRRPRLALMAPVKAPFTWPNNSLSRSVSVRAPQSMGRKGRSLRELLSWINLARSSLPVPLSPGSEPMPGNRRSSQPFSTARASICSNPPPSSATRLLLPGDAGCRASCSAFHIRGPVRTRISISRSLKGLVI